MATDLYEILEVSVDATPEQIRRAYKKKALQTHPDRLPPGASSEEKAASEELFRKVNNAYEVLTDTQNRRVYDLHGVWPPPEPPAPSNTMPRSGRQHAHPHRRHQNDFFSSTFHDHPFFSFRDPFSLFEDVFDPGSHHAGGRHHERAWFTSQLSDLMRDDFVGPTRGGLFMGGMSMGMNGLRPIPSGGGRWKSESFVTTTINGSTQTLHQRRDWDGNEHVTRTYSDGREIRTINGIEQPSSHEYIQYPGRANTGRLPPSTASRQPPVGMRASSSRSQPPNYPLT